MALLVSGLLGSGCLPKQLDSRSDPALGPSDPDYDRAVQVRFLGVGGFTIRRGRDVVMTAPLYSNPTLEDVLSYRVYYQDAPGERPWGYAPDALIREKAVDLALLCGGNFDAVSDPAGIAENLRAGTVIIHHWEDFFDARLKVIPFLPIQDFYDALLGKLSGDRRRLLILRPDVLKVFRSS